MWILFYVDDNRLAQRFQYYYVSRLVRQGRCFVWVLFFFFSILRGRRNFSLMIRELKFGQYVVELGSDSLAFFRILFKGIQRGSRVLGDDVLGEVSFIFGRRDKVQDQRLVFENKVIVKTFFLGLGMERISIQLKGDCRRKAGRWKLFFDRMIGIW